MKGREGLLLELLHLEEGWDRPAVGVPSTWGRLGWGFRWNSFTLKKAGIGQQLELLPLGKAGMGQQLVLHPLEGALGGLERGLMWNSRPLGRVRGGAYTRNSNAVSVAISRRRYPQRDFHGFGTFDNFPLRVTPTANRNSFRVALSFTIVPRVEALRTSTLGYEIATPTELPRVRTILSSHPTGTPTTRPTNPSHPTDTHTPRPTNPSHPTGTPTTRQTNPSYPTDNHTPQPPNSVHPVTIATIFLMTSAKIMTISANFLMTSTIS